MLLYGLEGEINVAGAVYNGQMPAWSQLSDGEIAGTLNHILTWGEGDALPGDFEAYTPEEIDPLHDEPLSPRARCRTKHARCSAHRVSESIR